MPAPIPACVDREPGWMWSVARNLEIIAVQIHERIAGGHAIPADDAADLARTLHALSKRAKETA